MGDRLATIDGPKSWGLLYPFFREEEGELGIHLTHTMWPGPRPTSLPIGILIHRAVWPNTSTSQTDRQLGSQTDSIGQTVLQTVAQKNEYIDN